MKDFRDRTAVITGAASGIGLELARRAAAEGMNLVLADIEGEKLAAAATGLGIDPAPAGAAHRRQPREKLAAEAASPASAACTCCATTPASD